MTATKTTKIAALVTAICLMLSSVMMLGKTYAWFTDEAKSGDNIITSGTLDIEMSYSDKIDGTYINVEDEGVDPIFSYDLWEPGYTQVRYIKIANNGNLALKYKLTLITNEKATIVDGKEVKLSDVIDVYVGTSEVKSRGDLVNMKKVGTLADLIADEDGAAYGIMLPAEGAADVELNSEDAHLVTTGEQTYCVVLHMQETAGNEYQNLSVGLTEDDQLAEGEVLGISVELYADQYTWENDSFDNTYDENAGLPVADVKGESPEGITATWGMNNIQSAHEMDLDTAFVFRTTETAEEAAAGEQAYWHVDFVVSADKDVPADSIALAGYYEAYCEGYNGGHWVALKSDEDIKAGDEIRLLKAMLTGGSMSYQELCNWVPEFKCGAVDLTGENNGTTLTVELRMYEMKKNAASTDEETGKYYTIGTYSYTFGANTPEKLTAALNNAMANGGTVVLSDDVAMPVDSTVTVPAGKEVTLDLNGHTLSTENKRTATHNIFVDVNGGTLTVENGTVEMKHTGANMGWNGAATAMNVTGGGVLNLKNVTVVSEGTDMNFGVHLNNWGEVTLNADNCVFKSTYCGVRVFNSGPAMNNVKITNSTMTGATRAFWVHNYTSADMGGKVYSGASAAYDEAAVIARLNLDIYNNNNTFEITGTAKSPIRYGFNNAVYYDATSALVP